MYPDLFTVPVLDMPVKSFGILFMIGFVLAVWATVRRGKTIGADTDVIINMAFLSMIGGLVGARLFFVVHYWNSQFVPVYWNDSASLIGNIANLARGVVDVSRGGMEFYGGMIGAIILLLIYLVRYRISIPYYFDIFAPSLMIGLAFGRVGCFLNGCCFGRVCSPDSIAAALALTFPAGSPVADSQFRLHDLPTPPALYFSSSNGRVNTIPYDILHTPQAKIDAYRAAQAALGERRQTRLAESAKAEGGQQAELRATINDEYQASLEQLRQQDSTVAVLSGHLKRHNLSMAELQEIAANFRSRPVYPVQLMAALSAATIWLVLEALFARRPRIGTVAAVALMLYPVNRFLEETIRNDNPLDTAGLTISQFIAVLSVVCGLGWLAWIYLRPGRAGNDGRVGRSAAATPAPTPV